MKRILLAILFLFLWYGSAFGATYHVARSAAGSGNGSDYANRMSISTFNARSGSEPGNIYYFYSIEPSANITTQVVPQVYGTSGSPVILDGYAGGDCDPITDSCASGALLSGSSGGLRIAAGRDYITVQDFRMTGGPSSNALLQVYNTTTTDSSDGITLKQLYLYDANGRLFTSSNRYGGDEGNYRSSNYLTIEDVKSTGYGKVTDTSGGHYLFWCENLIIKNSEFGGGGASECTSDNVFEVHHNTNFLFESNYIHDAYNQSGIAIKEDGSRVNSNGIVRYNKFYANGSLEDNGRGIALTSNAGYANHDIYIYGNYIYGGGDFGIDIHRGNYNIYVWSNIIADNDRNGIILWTASGYVAEHDIHLYNNTIYANETDHTGSSESDRTGIGIRESSADDIFIKNNILMDNRPNATSYQQWASNSTIGAGESDYNTLYYTGQTASYYYDGAIRTLATMQGSYSLETNSEIAEPDFGDAAGGDFTLDSAGTAGVDLGNDTGTGCFAVVVQGTTYTICYNDGLNPETTDWTTTPPTVYTASRDTYGWERGAYVFGSGGEDVTAPTPNPATWSTEPAADSTSAISMTATTGSDVNTISVQFDFDPASDNCGSDADIGTGGSDRTWTETDYTHTDDTLQTNKVYCYNVQLRDSIPNTGTASSTVKVYTLAAVPGAPTLDNENDTTIDITANAENGNPSSNPTTTFAIEVGSTDSNWEGKYVDADGDASATKVWLTDAQLDAGITVGGDDTALKSGTRYWFSPIAKNGDGIETANSTEVFTDTTGGFDPPPTVTMTGIGCSGCGIN